MTVDLFGLWPLIQGAGGADSSELTVEAPGAHAVHDEVVEADVRAEVRQMLETKSNARLDAGDPHQALRIASQLRVDLLIPDVVSR